MGVVKNLMVRVGADLSGLVSGFNKASNAPESFKKRTEKAMQDSVLSVGNLKKAMAQGGKNAQIVSLVDQIRDLEAEQKAFKTAGFSWGFEGFEENERLLRSLKSELNGYIDSLNLAGNKAEETFGNAGGSAKRFGANVKAAFSNVKQKAKDLAVGGINLVGNGLKSMVSRLAGFRSGTNASAPGIERLTSTLKKFGLASLGIKLAGAMFGRLRSIVSSYISENTVLEAQVNSLKAGLGQALAPAINLVSNALSVLMPYIIGVSNAIGSLITNLLGSGWTTVADGASAAAAATSGAASAQEKYNRTLAGFDEITKLNDSSSSGSGGGGSASTTVTQTEGKLPAWLTDLSTQIKEAVNQGDYTAVGAILAGKLGEAVATARAKLNDSSFKSKVQRLTDNAAAIINGFFGKMTLDHGTSSSIAENIGGLIGDGIVLGLSTIDRFLEGVDFGNIGKALAQGINGAVSSLNASDSNLGSVIANVIQSGINGASGFVKNLNWSGVGKALQSNLKNLFTGINWSSLSNLLGSAVCGIGTMIVSSMASSLASAGEYFAQSIEEAGGNIVLGVLNGILKGIAGIGTWIADNIFWPFVEGFKETFQIHSPSKHKEITSLGTNIIAGVLNGIVTAMANPVAWIQKNVFRPLVDGFSKVFGENGYSIKLGGIVTSWKDGLKDKTIKFTAKLTTWKETLQNKYLDFKANIKKGWSGSLADKLGISTITSKLNMKLPKISIDWGETTVFSKTFRYPKGFNIKWNAQGLIMNGATLFGSYGNTLLGGGEAGREALLPLDRNTGWMDKIADRVALRVVATQSSPQEITINLVLDGKVIAKTVVKHVNTQAKATGIHPFAAYI